MGILNEENIKNNKKKRQSKNRFNDPIKKCANIKANLLKAVYNLTVTKFKLDKDRL